MREGGHGRLFEQLLDRPVFVLDRPIIVLDRPVIVQGTAVGGQCTRDATRFDSAGPSQWAYLITLDALRVSKDTREHAEWA